VNKVREFQTNFLKYRMLPKPRVQKYCKTLYFRCILISRFWNTEISLHFNLAFSQCSTDIYQTFDDGKTEFLRVFNFVILSYSRNSRKFDACEKCFSVSRETQKIHCMTVLNFMFSVQSNSCTSMKISGGSPLKGMRGEGREGKERGPLDILSRGPPSS